MADPMDKHVPREYPDINAQIFVDTNDNESATDGNIRKNYHSSDDSPAGATDNHIDLALLDALADRDSSIRDGNDATTSEHCFAEYQDRLQSCTTPNTPTWFLKISELRSAGWSLGFARHLSALSPAFTLSLL